jgi:hypothetical protein
MPKSISPTPRPTDRDDAPIWMVGMVRFGRDQLEANRDPEMRERRRRLQKMRCRPNTTRRIVTAMRDSSRTIDGAKSSEPAGISCIPLTKKAGRKNRAKDYDLTEPGKVNCPP